MYVTRISLQQTASLLQPNSVFVITYRKFSFITLFILVLQIFPERDIKDLIFIDHKQNYLRVPLDLLVMDKVGCKYGSFE